MTQSMIPGPRPRFLRMLAACSLVAAADFTGASAQQFLQSPIPGAPRWSDGVELADVDGDGDLDVLFANGSAYGGSGSQGSQPQHLFLNDGAGSFTAAHGQLNVANFNAKLVVAEDFDDDGDKDLIYASGSTGSPPRLLINDGTGNFSDETITRIPNFSSNPRSFSVAVGDIDNDGDLDIAVSDGGTFNGIASQAILLANNGSGVFTNVTGTQMPSDTYNCQDIQFFDFDGDFDLDMALSGKGQGGKRSRLYLNDGSGMFSVDMALNNLGTANTYEIDYADLDGDNDFDASVQSISGTSEGWARNDGPGVAMAEFTFPSPNGNDDNEVAHMDYDNDGDLDVFVASLASTEKLYRNDGGGVFTAVSSSIQSVFDSSLDMDIGDLDGDGDYDFVTAQGESGNFTNRVYRNVGSADSIAPRFLNVEEPGGLGGDDIVFRAHVQDAVGEDGQSNASVAFAYTTSDGGAASGQAVHQGGGMFRAPVPTTTATRSIELTWTASDASGNQAAVDVVADVEGSCDVLDPSVNGTGIGNVTVVQETDGSLTVDNFGTSGANGLEFCASGALAVGLAWSDLSAAPDGALLHLGGRGTVHGIADQALGSLTVQHIGGSWDLIADVAPLGLSTWTAHAYAGGELLASVPMMAGDVIVAAAPPSSGNVGMEALPGGPFCTRPEEEWLFCLRPAGTPPPGCPQAFASNPVGAAAVASCCASQSEPKPVISTCRVPMYVSCEFDVATSVMIGQLMFAADKIIFGVESSTMFELAEVTLTGAMLGPLSVEPPTFEAFQLEHGLLGQAVGHALDGTFEVELAGSSGDDGVSVDLGTATNFTMAMADDSVISSSSSLVMETIGVVGGQVDAVIGQVSVSASAAVHQIEVDITTDATPLARLFDGAVLLGEWTMNGAVTSTTWPSLMGAIADVDHGFAVEFAGATSLDAGIAGTFNGSDLTLMVLADSPTSIVSHLARVDVLGTEVSRLVVPTEERVDNPWQDLGFALSGTASPSLVGLGSLVGDQPLQIVVIDGIPSGSTNLIVGVSRIDAPFKGGTLVPSLDIVLFGVPLDAGGALELAASMPTGFTGIELVLQAWSPDAGAPFGFSATNALSAVSP